MSNATMRELETTVTPSMANDDLFFASRSPNPLEDTIERVTGTIRARLLDPGDRLPAERDLAAQLGVSRSTLRVALQTLTDAGWLEVRRGRHGGSFVMRWPRMPHPRKLAEVLGRYRSCLPGMLDYRRAVECAAAQFAAERAIASDIDELVIINESMYASRTNFEGYRRADARFHIAVARAAHSQRIMQAVTEVQASMTEVLDVIIYQSKESLPGATEHHRALIAAIRDQDTGRAYRVMLEHVRATEDIIYKLVGE